MRPRVQRLSLNGRAWRFGEAPPQPLAFTDDDRAHVAVWRTAQVPGHVQADLLDHHLLPDPDVADGAHRAAWVETRDWWYTCDIDLALEPHQRAFVRFDGLDYIADVWWNAHRVTRHIGQFVPAHLELTPFLPRDGRSHTHTLAVRFWGPHAWPEPRWSWLDRLWKPIARRLHRPPESLCAYHPRLGHVRCQMSYGWDFAPRLLAFGLWDDVHLITTGSVHLRNVWVDGNPDAPCAWLELDAARPERVRLELRWQVVGEPQTLEGVTAVVNLHPGRQRVPVRLPITQPRLWSPWDIGTPTRYALHVRVFDGDGESDAQHTTFGLRRLVWDGWRLQVNGTPFFMRGVNWVPADLLYGRLTRADYEPLVRGIRDANANIVRVWGGGLREKRAFYDVCDELGLLVWQDLPFACAFLDRFPRDRAFLDLAETSAAAIVRAVRGHPSVALYCAGNEYGPRRNAPLVKRLRRAVQREDPTRPFKPPSPSAGESHQWLVWHGFAPLTTYTTDNAQIISEAGLQALPSLDTWRRAEPDAPIWPPNPAWVRRYGEWNKAERYVRAWLGGRMPRSAEEAVLASQQAQAWGVQLVVEHQRRRKAEAAGVLIWQYNEPWPAISWALLDHDGRPKAALKRLARLYAPVAPALDVPPAAYARGDTLRGTVWVVNDTPHPLDNLRVRILEGGRVRHETTCTALPSAATPAWRFTLTLDEPVWRIELWRGEQVLTWEMYDLRRVDMGAVPPAYRLRRFVAKLVMRF